MGSSRVGIENVLLTKRKETIADEVWACNAMARLLSTKLYDKAFIMDDIKQFFDPKYDIEPGCDGGVWLRECGDWDVPIVTSTAYPEVPASVDYPLKDVMTNMGLPVFPDTTTAYALVYAIYLGAKEIKLYGTDFLIPGMSEDQVAELAVQDLEMSIRGKQTLNFWIGVAMGKGIKVTLADTSEVLMSPPNKHLGYGTTTLYGYNKDFHLPTFLNSLSEKPNVT